ncbi:hypothetical protein WOLCODRAFT_27634 [Wolfiporia cocos MD-104 SS10]|uniref:Uncharacterized protein n=1 Tax=Wolfiporia cocos (strain MD-104) TaxID=742152 RepID=A0A2H3J068_WOLCO|nr:hypothetical protein WOLCODRAFT_27634 [Wolfiporia cocos MD-104 SS10]
MTAMLLGVLLMTLTFCNVALAAPVGTRGIASSHHSRATSPVGLEHYNFGFGTSADFPGVGDGPWAKRDHLDRNRVADDHGSGWARGWRYDISADFPMVERPLRKRSPIDWEAFFTHAGFGTLGSWDKEATALNTQLDRRSDLSTFLRLRFGTAATGGKQTESFNTAKIVNARSVPARRHEYDSLRDLGRGTTGFRWQLGSRTSPEKRWDYGPLSRINWGIAGADWGIGRVVSAPLESL